MTSVRLLNIVLCDFLLQDYLEGAFINKQQRERERASECVCVCVCVCERERERESV